MEPDFILKVGKKGAIYLPRKLIKKLGISEGDKVLVRVKENKVILEFIPDPISLALKTKKWASTTVKEFEKESERMQEELYGD
ncbi:MAG: AbrB/MazE/SpoVT family DNA-binding domain-containing protein [Candidatus Njordarchaeales archaeon]